MKGEELEPEAHLFDLKREPIPVTLDYGPISPGTSHGGVTGARRVVAADGHEYVAKSDGLTPEGVVGTHILLQEWVCARLAEALNLPIPAYNLLDFQGTICFGSRWLDKYADRFVPALLGRVINPQDLYRIAAFDAWIMNQDRHEFNLVTAIINGHPTLVAIDHSHCPLYGGEEFGELTSKVDRPAFMAIRDFVSRNLTERRSLAAAVYQIRDLSDQCIWDLTAPPCPDSCTRSERQALASFLVARRNSILELFNSYRDRIPALMEEPL